MPEGYLNNCEGIFKIVEAMEIFITGSNSSGQYFAKAHLIFVYYETSFLPQLKEVWGQGIVGDFARRSAYENLMIMEKKLFGETKERQFLENRVSSLNRCCVGDN